MKIEGEGEDEASKEYRQRLEAKLEPWRIRATLSFAALYQIVHEQIKTAVLHEVRQFYWRGWDDDGVDLYDEATYRADVLAKAPQHPFRASLLWLVEGDAITAAQADRLDEIYAHRHELSHELIKYVVDPDHEPDVDSLSDALEILKSIRRFWTGIEKDIGSFEGFGDVDIDQVMPLSLMVLQMCLDAYAEGLHPSPPVPDDGEAPPDLDRR